ncbi:MAG: M48 family metallopeptidase [Prevotella sp.]|nr:M48 family metallopeptidase [Prevotella sp.]
MKKVKFILLSIVTSILVSCGTTSTVPITGRKHRLSVSDEYVLSLSTQQYNQYLQQSKKSTNAQNTAMVKRVGQRLATAVETYLKNNGFANEVKNFAWEFNLVADNQANAFCMPGGKIVVYEGILPITKDEASLAIVLGHEIAHAVAKHSAEQMTKSQNSSTLVQLGGGVLSALGVDQSTTQVAASVAQQGLSLLNLKYSRDNESEADYMGLIFAAMAGYDPNVAITFWQRMAAQSQGQQPTWLSSHPSDAKRVSDLQKHLPEALLYYKKQR